MLTITTAIVALLTPVFFPSGVLNAPTGPNEYTVDLRYQLNKGQDVTEYDLVEFRNVRFAAPPTGALRFRPPTSPPINRTGLQNAADVICPQALPKWLTTGDVTPFTPANIPPVDPRTSEDCLFLDVLLPKKIWETRRRSQAPVLVWIHGGGFGVGWKDLWGKGYGLVTRSQRSGSQGVILVSVNYRLGLFVSAASILWKLLREQVMLETAKS
ncbi:MAG: hypothetical protein Q9225_002268 [Loekoesia sp. 1 TL-2023]